MKRLLLGVAALSLLALPTAFATAQSGYTAIQADCMKQYGAYEDPKTKRLRLQGCSSSCFLMKLDAIYACVAQKTGKPVTPFIRSNTRYLP